MNEKLIILINILLLSVFYLGCDNNINGKIPVEYKDSVLRALKESENEKQLKQALFSLSGNEQAAACQIISLSPKIDIINITSNQLVDHIKTTFETNNQVPWSIPTNSPIFTKFVLPNRIACESFDMSRRKLKKLVFPYVKDCKTPNEAINIITERFISRKEPNKFQIGTAYPNDYTPINAQIFGITNDGWNCRAKVVFLVGALRSVGIPAAKSECSSWLDAYDTHSFITYYDKTDDKWHMFEVQSNNPIDDKALIARQDLHGVSSFLASPAYTNSDYYGKKRLEKLINIGTNSYPHGNITIYTKGNNKRKAMVSIYVWFHSLNSWYPNIKLQTDKNGKTSFDIGANISAKNQFNPYMITVGLGDKIDCQYINVAENGEYSLFFDIDNPKTSNIEVKGFYY